jgi:hypothetical protein
MRLTKQPLCQLVLYFLKPEKNQNEHFNIFIGIGKLTGSCRKIDSRESSFGGRFFGQKEATKPTVCAQHLKGRQQT